MLNLIKKIREQTGLSVSDIKRALDEAGGREERALELLRLHGHRIAEKKSSRQASQGIVESYVHSNGKMGVILVLNCETDFVAKSSEFKALAHDLAMQIASMDPKDAEELMSQPFVKDQGRTVKDLITDHIAKLGENIKVGKFSRLEI